MYKIKLFNTFKIFVSKLLKDKTFLVNYMKGNKGTVVYSSIVCSQLWY
jgi:hypothetical protein